MIEVKNIVKSYAGKEILKGVSAAFKPATVSLIIGASGTGKSVLLKSIVGLTKPDSGEVFYDNRSYYDGDEEDRKQIRREIGMLFQGSALFDSKKVEANVAFPLEVLVKDMAKSEKMDRVNDCLKRVGLEGSNKKFPSELSGGMKKRVGIARAIVMNPRYLFVDEPNSGLDPMTSVKIDLLIEELTEEYNTTTVVVTHDMNSVMGIGQHIIFLHEGLKLWEGNKNTILENTVPELEEFIFSSKMMRSLRKTGLESV